MRNFVFLLFLISIMSSCSLTLPVRGQVQNSDKKITITATGYMSGLGDLQIVSNKGTVCKGNFVLLQVEKVENCF